MNTEILSVSQLNRQVRDLLQKNLSLLWVAGEVSNLTRAASGHLYFSLKDASAQVRCVMFRNRAQLIPWKLENGQQVEVQALASLYEARGDYQLGIETLRRAGRGRLFEAYARLLAQLEMEGLFAPSRKRALPQLPRGLGVICSPQAAALQDILTALERRCPHLPVILYPTPVQGDTAATSIAAAIATANQRAAQDQIDVLILARGGGSIEDLWAFNEEIVARAIVASHLPIIVGVGHETDVTIADHAADQRAATPTAAAEMASAGWVEIRLQLANHAHRLTRSLRIQLETRMQRLDLLQHRLIHPGRQLQADRRQLEHVHHRLQAAWQQQVQQNRQKLLHARLQLQRPDLQNHQLRLSRLQQQLATLSSQIMNQQRSRLSGLEASLKALSPQATLMRGYSIVRTSQGKLLRSSHDLLVGEKLNIRFAQGQSEVEVRRITES